MGKPKDYDSQRKCAGKVAYASSAAAEKVVRRLSRAEDENGVNLGMFVSAYGCHCGKFHVGKRAMTLIEIAAKVAARPGWGTQ